MLPPVLVGRRRMENQLALAPAALSRRRCRRLFLFACTVHCKLAAPWSTTRTPSPLVPALRSWSCVCPIASQHGLGGAPGFPILGCHARGERAPGRRSDVDAVAGRRGP